MGSTKRPRKVTDYETGFPFAGGIGILREEVWMGPDNKVVRYNLAFVVPHLTQSDHGRILGYDNRHGVHERRFMGKIQIVGYKDFPSTANRFYREVAAFRRNYEGEGIHRWF